jgi:hypothetical protein
MSPALQHHDCFQRLAKRHVMTRATAAVPAAAVPADRVNTVSCSSYSSHPNELAVLHTDSYDLLVRQ